MGWFSNLFKPRTPIRTVIERLQLQPGLTVEVLAYETLTPTAEQILADWPRVAPEIEACAREAQENYLDGKPGDPIWSTMNDPSLFYRGPGSCEFTCTFSWQSPDDGHSCTFYVENFQGRGMSVDG